MGSGGAPRLVDVPEHEADEDEYKRSKEAEARRPSPGALEAEAAGQDGGGPSGSYEVVFVKDQVSVHPSPAASERISGRLRLVKQGQSVFLTWIPYNQAEISEDGSWAVPPNGGATKAPSRSERDRNLYTIRAVSVSEIRSIRRHTPTLGWNYIIIVLTTGLAFPPLYFHNGGVREFLNVLKEHALLVRSAEDANVYLVNDVQDPLQRSLTSFDLMEAVGPTAVTDTSAAPEVPPSPTDCQFSGGALPGLTRPPSLPRSPSPVDISQTRPQEGVTEQVAPAERPEDMSISRLLHGPEGKQPKSPEALVRDASMQILEKFSLVTRFARDATNHILGKELHPATAGSSSYLAGPAGDPGLKATLQEDSRQPGSTRPPLALSPAAEILERTTSEGVPAAVPSKSERDELEQSALGVFELVEGTAEDSPALVWGRPRPPPLGLEEWATFLDSEGRVAHPKALQKRVFHGGVEHNARREVWKFLLGYFDYGSTFKEREALQAKKREEYAVLKAQWQSVSEAQARRFAKFRERKSRVDKDVVRTDRSLPFFSGDDNPNVQLLRDILITYSFYNFDLGYCQGMSDLLSPLLYVMRDEAEAFWCFAALMERMASNFHRDQNGMHNQLLSLRKLVAFLDPPLHEYFSQTDCLNYFFCFRWILIHFKREFAYEDVLRLWEVLWSRHLSAHFHLYLCAAILKRHRRKIMDEQMEFDTLLKFINELSGKVDLESSLRDAEALCRYAGATGEACMPPAPPPTDEAVLSREVELMRSDSFQ